MAKSLAPRNYRESGPQPLSQDEEITDLSTEDIEFVEEGSRVIRYEAETRVSESHKERNDDKILGAPDRKSSKLGTAKPEWDNANIAALSEKEAKVSQALADRGVYGVFDGVSAGGAGVLASRIASGTIAERMATLSKNSGIEASRQAIVDAIKSAHADVLRYRAERPDLKNMSSTADIIRAIDNNDGSFDVAYGHVGDSRIYVFNAESGKLTRQTDDESLAEIFHRGGTLEQEGMKETVKGGQVTREELDRIMAGEELDIIQNASARGVLKMMRNPLMNAVGFPKPNIDVRSGVIKLKPGERLFVMTDGVHGTLSDEEIAEVMRSGGGQKELMDAASKSRSVKKSHDDISIVELNFESASSAARNPIRESAALRKDVAAARAEVSALETLLAKADAGDVDALSKVSSQYEGRENVRDIILGLNSRRLSREQALVKQEGGAGAEARLREIGEEIERNHKEMKGQIARHERSIRSNLTATYEEIDSETSAPQAKADQAKPKKSLWKRLTGR